MSTVRRRQENGRQRTATRAEGSFGLDLWEHARGAVLQYGGAMGNRGDRQRCAIFGGDRRPSAEGWREAAEGADWRGRRFRGGDAGIQSRLSGATEGAD